MNLFNTAGGLKYHTRALIHKNRAWSGFIKHLNLWLESWPVDSKKLLLIGPSGGYCLEQKFLERFERVSVVEIDPLARLMFRWKFSGSNIKWDSQDYFSPEKNVFTIDPILKLLDSYPNHNILFTNLLGQLTSLYRDPLHTFEYWKHDFLEALKGRNWASFHDRLSGSIPLVENSLALISPRKLNNHELVKAFFSADEVGQVLDHNTGSWFQQGPRTYLSWPLTKKQNHIIECYNPTN